MFFAVRQGIVVCKSRHAGKKKKTKNRLENTILCKRENAPFRRVVSAVHFKPKLLYHKCFLKKIGKCYENIIFLSKIRRLTCFCGKDIRKSTQAQLEKELET